MILVSACLLGENCKYSGGNNRREAVCRFLEGRDYIAFCPERAGGLPTPRLPSERRGAGVVARDGTDVTEAFRLGAERALALCREKGVTLAIFKEGSPSCGSRVIYDGSFSGRKIPGRGVTAELLEENGISVLGEDELPAEGDGGIFC